MIQLQLLKKSLTAEVRAHSGAVCFATEMDTTARSESGDMTSVDRKGLAALQQSFNQVQFLLEHNRLLIKEINRNHRSRIPENLSRNTALINELNGNINRVLCLYANLSTAFLKTFEFSSDVNTAGTSKTDKVMLKSATVQGLKRDVLALENQLLGLQVGTSSASNVGSF